jgi:gliding motility-associated-like protein
MIKKIYFAFCLFLFSLISYSQKLLIAENGATDIRRSNTDGTSLEVISGFASVNAIRSMVFDEQRNTVFWIESNTLIKKASLIDISGNTRLGFASNYASVTGANFQSLAVNPLTRQLIISSGGSIYKTNLDATGTIAALPAAYIAGVNAAGIDIDLVNGKIYYIRPITTTEIWIANLNAPANPTQIVADSQANDIAVDPIGGKIYHTVNIFFPTSEGQIVSRNLTTGANPVPIVTGQPLGLRGIAIDKTNGFLFWADGTSAIGRSSLTGTGKINVVTGLNAPIDVALDFSSTLPPKLYWTEPNVNEVQHINTNGSDFERYHFNSFSTPNGIAIDQDTRYAYWTDETQANIIKGFIDETNFSDLDTLIDYPNAANGIGGIALDPSNHMMYFAYTAGGRVQRADYNFTPTPIPAGSIQDIAIVNNPFGVALDLKRRKIYFTSNSMIAPNIGTLTRANLDGTNPEPLITQTTTAGLPQKYMHDVKVDPKNGYVYWASTEANGPGAIYRADISDVMGTVTPLINPTAGEIRGIEIDWITDKIWWVSRGVNPSVPPAIMQAKLSDGTGVNSLHPISFTPPRANFIALDRGCDQPIASALFMNAPLGQSSTADPVITSYHHINDIIQVSITQAPTKGVATLQPDGKIFYTPNSGTVGTDAIDYQICNQCGLCDQATINVTIPNVPPVIAPSASIQIENGSIATLPLSTLLSDLNNNLDISSLTVIVPPASGASASFNTNNELIVDYTGITFSGVDNLTIEVCDLALECTTSVISITVDPPVPVTPEIIVYNGISPNDDVFNPFFKLENIEVVAPQNKVSIFNRWGDKVFEVDNYDNSDPTKRFNGESDKGKALPSGVYFYKIEFTSGSQELSGYLTLKR